MVRDFSNVDYNQATRLGRGRVLTGDEQFALLAELDGIDTAVVRHQVLLVEVPSDPEPFVEQIVPKVVHIVTQLPADQVAEDVHFGMLPEVCHRLCHFASFLIVQSPSRLLTRPPLDTAH